MPNLASKSVPIIQYNGEEKTPYNLSRSAIKEWALKNVVDEDSFIIDSNGEKHYCPITATSLNKYIDDSANDKSVSRKVHLLALPLLSKILANSIEVEVHPDYIKKNGERMPENGVNSQVLIHRFYGDVEIEGVVYRTKTTVKEYRDKNTHLKPYTYEVTKIELLAPATDNVKDNTTNHPRTPSNSINATKLLQKVEKSYDKGIKVLEESISSEENSTQALTTANGEMVADVNEAQGQALFSLRTYREEGRGVLADFLATRVADGALTEREASEMMQQMDDIYNLCMTMKDEYAPFGQWSEAKVVEDENGNPKVVYHQTNHSVYINRETGQNWDELDWRERMEWDERDDWDDYWEKREFNTFSRVNARTTQELDGFFFAPEYDGVINEEDGAIWEYVAFNPNQIKSADPVTYDDAGNVRCVWYVKDTNLKANHNHI